MRSARGVLLLAAFFSVPALAAAQTIVFDRSFEVTAPPALEVTTTRGTIDIAPGETGRVVVRGRVTVRPAWTAPADALAIAQRVAAHPPVSLDGQTVRLLAGAPEDDRAVTISYRVEVPATTAVRVNTESGATTVRGVRGALAIETQSAAIDVRDVTGATTITTGSGAVSADAIASTLSVETQSSGVEGQGLAGPVSVHTGSGGVELAMAGEGGVDVETSSSAIRVRNVRGGVRATTRSGHITIDGAATAAWFASTGSGSVELRLFPGDCQLDASSGSGSVTVTGGVVHGAVDKRHAAGRLGRGGAAVRAESRSGSIRITVGGQPR